MTEHELLEAAKGGDEAAFGRLVQPYRAELLSHGYRMLGSVHDAEDALQDAMLRAWRGLGGFEGRSSLRSWLYSITSNACLRAIERRPKLVVPIDYGPATDPHDGPAVALEDANWMEPFPDDWLDGAGPAGPEARYEQRESIELAFIAALQHLPPRQRAVLILRDVLGFSGAEVANVLDTTPASVYSALQRAHKTIDGRLPERSQQATLQALGDDQLRRVVDAYVTAWERSDVDAIASMLTEDAVIAMPPIPTWYSGRQAVADFIARTPLGNGRRWRVLERGVNGQVGLGHYVWDEDRDAYVAHSMVVLTLRGPQVAGIMAFIDPEAFSRFGLPATVG